jgi:formylglycine-generating enzyme
VWQYTLPTSAQWEYACRAGSNSRYSFGVDESTLGGYAWFNNNAHLVGEDYAHQVGKKKANSWGLFDMHGNVWECCRDWCPTYWNPDLSRGVDPLGPVEGSDRVYRGGSFGDFARNCWSASRRGYAPRETEFSLGFRVAAVPAGK